VSAGEDPTGPRLPDHPSAPTGPRLPDYPGAPGSVPEPDQRTWHRLHPLSAVVRAGRSLTAVVVLLVVSFGSRRRVDATGLLIDGIVIVLILALGVISWLVTRWRIEGNVLRIDSGLIRRDSQRLPLTQIQAIDVVAPGIARLLGLAELRLRMAGSSGKGGRLSYLPVAEANNLRARLLALAHGHAEDTPAPPERPLLVVPVGRLIASLVISTSGASVLVVAVGLVVLAIVDRSAFSAVIATWGFLLLGVLTALWRKLNSGYKLTLAEAADGLRVRSGLVQTTAETIPIGRIQAARWVQPILWRPFGWSRLLVDVAGKQRQSRENASEGKRLRALLPVGTTAEAQWLVARLIPDAPTERRPAPPRARWKSPLRYRKLTWGSNATCVVTTSGRLRRVTDWVPLAKVQSIRRVEGPVQRSLGLGSVHLDTAGRGIDATIRDRDRAECDAIVEHLPVAARAARGAEVGLGGRRP
jgi:putative membrane protein